MDHIACQITIGALGAALSASISLNLLIARKYAQQGAMLTKLASAAALLNEKLIERLSQRNPYTPRNYSPASQTPSSSI